MLPLRGREPSGRSYNTYVNYLYFCPDYICSMERNGAVLHLYIDIDS